MASIEMKSVTVLATAEEYFKLAEFFQQASEMLEHDNLGSMGIELPDSKPAPLTGIVFLAMPPSR